MSGTKNGSSYFTIGQDICVAVPVEFGAIATVEDTYVDCNGASGEDICDGCDKESELETPITSDVSA